MYAGPVLQTGMCLLMLPSSLLKELPPQHRSGPGQNLHLLPCTLWLFLRGKVVLKGTATSACVELVPPLLTTASSQLQAQLLAILILLTIASSNAHLSVDII